MTTFEFGFVVLILPLIVVGIKEYIRERRCAVCNKAVLTGEPKVLDSYYGLQYICSDECWDNYEGWYCDVCLYLHDNDTTMESDNSCIE